MTNVKLKLYEERTLKSSLHFFIFQNANLFLKGIANSKRIVKTLSYKRNSELRTRSFSRDLTDMSMAIFNKFENPSLCM